MVSAKEQLLSKIPEVQKQQKRFEQVFGKDTSEQIKKEEQQFEKKRFGNTGGAGGSSGGGSTSQPTSEMPSQEAKQSPVVKQNIGESQAAYQERVRQVNQFRADVGTPRRNIGESQLAYNARVSLFAAVSQPKQVRQEGINLVSTRAGVMSEQEIKSTQEGFAGLLNITGNPKLRYLTPEQASTYRGREPVFIVESLTSEEFELEKKYSTGGDGIIKTGIGISTFKGAGGGFGLSTGQVQSNIVQISLAKQGVKRERDLLYDVKRTEKEFIMSPQSFEGKQGVTTQSTEEGVRYTLGEDYFKTLPSYKRIEAYESNIGEGGQLKESVIKSEISKAKDVYFTKVSTKERFKASVAEQVVAANKLGQGIGYGLSEYTLGFFTGFRAVARETPEGEIITYKEGAIPKTRQYNQIMSVPAVQTTVTFKENPTKYISETIKTRPSVTTPTLFTVGLVTLAATGIVTNIKRYGVGGSGGGISETIRGASPIQPVKKIYTLDVQKELALSGKKGFEYQVVSGKDYASNYIRTVGRGKDAIEVSSISSGRIQDSGKIKGIYTSAARYGQYEIRGSDLIFSRPTTYSSGTFTAAPYKEGFVFKTSSGQESFGLKQEFKITDRTDRIKGTRFIGGERVAYLTKETPVALPSFSTEVKGVGLKVDITPKGTGGDSFGSGGIKRFFGSGQQQQFKSFTIPSSSTLSTTATSSITTTSPITSRVFPTNPFQTTKQESRVVSQTKLKPFSTTIQIQSPEQKTRTFTPSGQAEVLEPIVKTRTTPISLQIPSLTQTTKQQTKLVPIQINELGLIPPISPRQPVPFSEFTPPSPIIPIGFFPALGFFESRGTRPKVKRKFKRKPSIAAVELGITAPKIRKEEISGLSLRPIIS